MNGEYQNEYLRQFSELEPARIQQVVSEVKGILAATENLIHKELNVGKNLSPTWILYEKAGTGRRQGPQFGSISFMTKVNENGRGNTQPTLEFISHSGKNCEELPIPMHGADGDLGGRILFKIQRIRELDHQERSEHPRSSKHRETSAD